jgi:hypothetical protein
MEILCPKNGSVCFRLNHPEMKWDDNKKQDFAYLFCGSRDTITCPLPVAFNAFSCGYDAGRKETKDKISEVDREIKLTKEELLEYNVIKSEHQNLPAWGIQHTEAPNFQKMNLFVKKCNDESILFALKIVFPELEKINCHSELANTIKSKNIIIKLVHIEMWRITIGVITQNDIPLLCFDYI